MRAAVIVDELESRVRRQHGPGVVVLREWGVGAGSCRMDLGVVNGHITGIEVKASGDDFGRLSRQVPAYSAVVDRAVLVVESDRAARHAPGVVPAWWGVIQASATPNGGVVLRTLRPRRPNPSPDPFSIAQLLWRDEAFAVLRDHELALGLSRATRWLLWERLAAELSVPVLRHHVRQAIKARQVQPDDGQ